MKYTESILSSNSHIEVLFQTGFPLESHSIHNSHQQTPRNCFNFLSIFTSTSLSFFPSTSILSKLKLSYLSIKLGVCVNLWQQSINFTPTISHLQHFPINSSSRQEPHLTNNSHSRHNSPSNPQLTIEPSSCHQLSNSSSTVHLTINSPIHHQLSISPTTHHQISMSPLTHRLTIPNV